MGATLHIDPELARKLPLNILLAEDSPINQRVVLHLLSRLGYRADVALNGREVVEAIAARPYDVVLMDVHMPELDGLHATRQIRAAGTSPTPVRIIAMTADATEEDRARCLAAGMDDYITKPVQVEQLVAALRRVREGTLPGEPVPGQVDMGAIDKLRALAADQADLFVSLVRDHIQNVQALMADMRRALTSGDLSLLERSAHSLRSSAAMFGAVGLAARAAEVETASRENVAAVPELLQWLETEVQLVQETLSREIPARTEGTP